mgnify:CR=1 FL=1
MENEFTPIKVLDTEKYHFDMINEVLCYPKELKVDWNRETGLVQISFRDTAYNDLIEKIRLTKQQL